MVFYWPEQDELTGVAERARLSNLHLEARPGLLNKISSPPDDWDMRVLHGVPGPIWTVPSDTCMTGRPNAPLNIAYDDYGTEFVFRQPRNEDELVGLMSAETEEVFACYRFDGLQRWTPGLVDAWQESLHVFQGWLRDLQMRERDSEIAHGARVASDYFASPELTQYLDLLRGRLRV